MSEIKYIRRLTDSVLELKLKAFGAILIVGPKGCGKTTTGKHYCKSILELQDEENREQYLKTADISPSKLLIGKNPRLIDEWQDAPKLWGAVRKSVDDKQAKGLYILTGSTSKIVETPHTGTGRISTIEMLPMSLYEQKLSSGEVSLMELFDFPDAFDGCHSELSMDRLILSICSGGWPSVVNTKDDKAKCIIAKDYFKQICSKDISSIDGVKRSQKICQAILKSYSRNICTLADTKTIMADVNSTEVVSKTTYNEYIDALEKLFVIEDIDAWNPSIRSKTAIRSSKKRNMIDPSIAVASLDVGPEYFNTDFETLGFLFESMCIRDLKIYSYSHDGQVSYYHDRYGLEADVVLHLADGRYALIEIKLGGKEIDKGADNLIKIESLIKANNETEGKRKIPLPTLKAVITATEYGYRRDDGVMVIPIGCLKD